MEHTSKTRLTTALILAAVFSSGVLLGFAADGNLGAEPVAEDVVASASESGDGEASEESSARRRGMYMQVEPNEEQLVRIDEIVAAHSARVEALDERLRAEYRAGRQVSVLETREAIMNALTPEQAAQYRTLLDEWDAERAAEREKRNDQD